MFLHNLIIALRNLGKYRLQTTISIASIAVGIVVLAAAHSYVQTRLQPPPLCNMPYYGRTCYLTLDSLNAEKRSGDTEKRPGNTEPWAFDPDVISFDLSSIRAMLMGGEFQCVEIGPTFPDVNPRYDNITACLGDSLKRKAQETIIQVEASYPHYIGYRSALTGEPIAPLRPGEAIVSDVMAKKYFGDANPVGATLSRSSNYGRQELTLVDVYVNPTNLNWPQVNTVLYAEDADAVVESVASGRFFCTGMTLILKEDCSVEQLEQEANLRLAHLGLKTSVKWQKECDESIMGYIVTMRTLVYLMAALILLAACIGFMRMQLQLCYMRKRELSLRIVNGAKRRDLFCLLMTEVALVVVAATAVALLFGSWLEPFANVLNNNFTRANIRIMEHVLSYSVGIGAGLLCLFGAVVWIALSHICNSAYRLAAGMRGSRSHLFRNVMLWLQVSVGMLFVSVAILATYVCNKKVQEFVLPEDDRLFKRSMFLRTNEVADPVSLLEALRALPDMERIIPHHSFGMSYSEIPLTDKVKEALGGAYYFHTCMGQDSALLELYSVNVKWLRPELKGGACILIQEGVYDALKREGLLANDILTGEGIFFSGTLPVAGTFDGVAYHKRKGEWQIHSIILQPHLKSPLSALVSKPGRYNALWDEVQATIVRLEPTVANQILFNAYDGMASEVKLLLNVRKGSWVLGGVALLICLIGIYSTIALDTRARRKEMAIRKINGAKPRDIALLFARLYVVLIALAMAVVIPLALVLRGAFVKYNYLDSDINALTVLLVSFAGCAIVILAIALIVGWQVRGIMRVNPASIIAKE